MTTPFTPREFRDCLGMFPTGVAIATASHGGRRAGITINSFASVSMDPPLVLFSVARQVQSMAVFEQADGFAVNVLAHDQHELCRRFAQAGADKWAGLEVRDGAHGGLLIHPSLVRFDCRLHQRHDGGDHVILVGEVVSLSRGDAEEPLVFFRSALRHIAPGALRLAA